MFKSKKNFIPRFNIHFKDGDNGGSGGLGDNGDQTTSIEMLQKELQSAKDSITKLTNKNSEILSENKNFRDRMKDWEGLDPNNVRNLLEKFSQDEELKLIAEGKHDEVIKKRVEKAEAHYKSQITDLTNKLNESTEQNKKASTQIRDLLIDSKVITAFHKEKGLENAADDVILRAQKAFTIENGEAIARDAKGEIIPGKNGALTILEWVENLKTTAPHLFEGSSGAGATGRKGGATGNDIDAKMALAAQQNNMAEYRRLRAEKYSSKK